MSTDSIEDLGGPSPEGRQGGSAGTGEFMTARATLYREDGDLDDRRVEVSSHRFQRGPVTALIAALEDAGADLESTARIEVEIGGEELTLKRTGWEIQ